MLLGACAQRNHLNDNAICQGMSEQLVLLLTS